MALATTAEPDGELRKPTCQVFWDKVHMLENNTQADFGASWEARLLHLLSNHAKLMEEPNGLPPARTWAHSIKLGGDQTHDLYLF